MQLNALNQSNFGQLIIQRDKDLKTLTPKQKEVLFFLQENKDRFKRELLDGVEDTKHLDIIAKAKKNGNIDLYVRKELPSVDKNHMINSFIPNEAQNKFVIKTSVNLTKKAFPAVTKQIAKFLKKCRTFIVENLSDKNKTIEKKVLDTLKDELAEFLIEQGISTIWDNKNTAEA